MKPIYLVLSMSNIYLKKFKVQWSSLQAFQTILKSHLHFNKHMSNNRYVSCTNYATASNNVELLAKNILANYSSNHEYDSVRIELIKSLILLQNAGVRNQDIEKHHDVLQTHFSYIKIQCLLKMKENPSQLLPLLILPLATLRAASKEFQEDKPSIRNFDNRLLYLQHQLELETNELIPLVIKHPTLLILPFSKLDMKMKILKDAKISTKYIVQDAWIFNYKETLLSQRAQAAQCVGFPLKPWHLRCPKKSFNICLLKWKETQKILQGEDYFGYLARRLDCSEKYVEYMAQRNISLPHVNVRKLEKLLDFLFEKGYTPEEIRLFPKVFCCSIPTLEKRFDEFQRIKGTIPTIPQITILSNFKKSFKGIVQSHS